MISRAEIDDAQRAEVRDVVARLAAGSFACVVVTSVNAIDELVSAAAHVATGLAASPTRWAAVGPATAQALRDVGIEPTFVAAENSARGLLAEWPDVAGDAGPGSNRVLLPLGDLAEPTLERGLPALGYEPVRITTYRTVSHPAPPEVVADWTAGRFDVVVLTSGSVAREVVQQLGARDDVLAVSIGEPTRRAAEKAGQRVTTVAAAATDDALFRAIISAVSTPQTLEEP